MVVKVEVFTSDSCPHCPAAVNVANEAKEIIGADMDVVICNIGLDGNRQKAMEYQIMAVPTIAIDNQVVFVGAPTLDELVDKVKSLI
ncbi:thioredoxin family protein [uncultured Methanobrevibacter sp.]|uniref:thioredoxin family protein n=1 Tax=uncultured Methanobrevibacter sp. TaxID=253161 RepID=UPI00262AB671|nr:thioredoxin family protein [uncultured Methanobrevibacter sp.]